MRYEIEIYTQDNIICKKCNYYAILEDSIICLYKRESDVLNKFFFCYKLRDGESVQIYDKEED